MTFLVPIQDKYSLTLLILTFGIDILFKSTSINRIMYADKTIVSKLRIYIRYRNNKLFSH